ncbi:hypothetical protein KUTeg_023075 [Tegillarca granosa]|uniref:Uncharacterized protein n=1 Tax=Tegillarca granosa TaxID=220873 RepID=A0ABQ9E1L1_TEGGR|nr:hypothetical protein KUTeg_023075 [Tegillarca granosa]
MRKLLLIYSFSFFFFKEIDDNNSDKKSVVQVEDPNSSDDIWNWLESHFTETAFPKWYYNGQVREAYLQRYLQNTFNMRLGFARVRQVRVKGLLLIQNFLVKTV